MPMLHALRNDHNGSGRQTLRFFTFFLIPSLTGGANQDLTAAGLGMVDMPVVAAARFKGYVGQEDGTLARDRQGVQIGISNKY